MNIDATPIEGLAVASGGARADQRGSFARLFCERELAPVIGARRILQSNLSRTNAVGAVRGLHFQHPPHAEMKLVRCLRGRVLDVAVDLRAGSATFLQWFGEELTPGNGRMMIIPEGFAHGFQVLEPDSEMLYLHTAFYDAPSEGGLRYNDPRLAIDWPLPAVDLSERDQHHPLIPTDFAGITL